MDAKSKGFAAPSWSLDDINRFIDRQRFAGLFGSGWAQFSADQSDSSRRQPSAPFMLANSRAQPPARVSRPTPAGSATATVRPIQPERAAVLRYGALQTPLPSEQEMVELRGQQAAQAQRARIADHDNQLFALPALLPPLAVVALEGGGAWLARQALSKIPEGPLNLSERDPYVRVGDNWATRAGRAAHKALKERLQGKLGWDYEPKVPEQPRVMPDVGTPQRGAKPGDRYYLELKPNTPTGRAAGARSVKRYRKATQRATRAIYYDPKDYM